MALTHVDVANIHALKKYLASPRTVGEMASYLHVEKMRAMDYLEILIRDKRNRVTCADVSGAEKRWIIE